MKRIATATVVFCFIAVLHLMGQTKSTTTSTSTSNPPAKPTSTSPAKPTSILAAEPTAKPVPKAVLYWDGTGPWQRPEGDKRAERIGEERRDKWPSATYEERESEEARREMNEKREFEGASQGSNNRLRCMGPERRPCRESEVREISHRMVERSVEHPALASIGALNLESSEGAVSCRQLEGGLCTPEQLWSLNEHVAKPLRCEIYDAANRTNPQSSTATAQNRTLPRSNNISTKPSTEPQSENRTSTKPTNEHLTEHGTSPAPNSAFTTPGSNPSAPNHNSMHENHDATAAARAAGWEHRTPVTQNHPTATVNSTPPRKQ